MTGGFPIVAITGAGPEVEYGAFGEVELVSQKSLMVVVGLKAYPPLTDPV